MAYVKSININSEENKLNFSKTSSLNKYLLCHYCEKKFTNRYKIEQHVQNCLDNRTCKWCKIIFKNRGNLVTHAYYIHGDKRMCLQEELDRLLMRPPLTNIVLKSVKSQKDPSNTCVACKKSFPNSGALKYHIRRVHFNLVAKVSNYDNKKINQVWYEKSRATDAIIEIRKVGPNALKIRRYNGDKPVTVEECRILLDVTAMYHTGNSVAIKTCEICSKKVLERDFKKHFDEKHGQVQKHHCNNCNMTFKRSYFYIRHTCNKERRRGKMQCQITKTESLTPITV